MTMPILALYGPAGSGKDTVAQIVSQSGSAVTVALADPLKRLARDTFWPVGCRHLNEARANDNAFWGPSEERSKPFAVDWEASENWFYQGPTDWAVREKYPTAACVDLYERWCWENRRRSDNGTVTARQLLTSLPESFFRNKDGDNLIVAKTLDTAFGLLVGRYGYSPQKGRVQRAGEAPDLVIIPDCRTREEVLEMRSAGASVVGIFDLTIDKVDQVFEEVPYQWLDGVVMNDRRTGLENLRRAVERVVRSMPHMQLPPMVKVWDLGSSDGLFKSS